jgi:hypothetical protein
VEKRSWEDEHRIPLSWVQWQVITSIVVHLRQEFVGYLIDDEFLKKSSASRNESMYISFTGHGPENVDPRSCP